MDAAPSSSTGSLRGASGAATSASASASASATAGKKLPPRNLQHLYAEATNLRLPSKMKEYYRFFQIPGIGNLAGGK